MISLISASRRQRAASCGLRVRSSPQPLDVSRKTTISTHNNNGLLRSHSISGRRCCSGPGCAAGAGSSSRARGRISTGLHFVFSFLQKILAQMYGLPVHRSGIQKRPMQADRRLRSGGSNMNRAAKTQLVGGLLSLTVRRLFISFPFLRVQGGGQRVEKCRRRSTGAFQVHPRRPARRRRG